MTDPGLFFLLGTFFGALLASAPGLRNVARLFWRPRWVVPVLLVYGTCAYEVVVKDWINATQWMAPAWGMSGNEFLRLAPRVAKFQALQTASAAQAVMTAWELDAFEIMRSSAVKPAEFAKRKNITETGARCLLEVLAELHLAEKTADGAFRHDWSDAGLHLIHTNAAFVTKLELPLVAHLTEAVKTGKAAGLNNVYGGKYKSLYHARTEVPALTSWTDMMNSVSIVSIATLMSRYNGLYSTSQRLLDFCGNEGQNAMELAKRFPQLEITVHDLPAVIEAPERGTAERLRRAGLLNSRVSVFPWDLSEPGDIIWPRQDYDIVQLLNCVNEWPRDELLNNLRAVLRALRPGGTLLIVGSFSSRTRVTSTAFRSVWITVPYFLTSTQDGGSMHDVEDLAEFATEAGFEGARVESWFIADAIIATKPVS